MPEILLPFPDKPSWDAWRAQHAPVFTSLRQAVVDRVLTNGFVEPLTGIHRWPEDISIRPDALHESISCQEMNSRKRALLLVLQTELRIRGWLGRRNLRILAPEALSRLARVLRGSFPYFYGTEYLPTEMERRSYFPVPHMDLQKTNLPDNSFDVFISGDVLEHIPDPEAAWAEIRRVVKPGGLIISSFPFDPNRATTLVKAHLNPEGQIEHLTAPEYHGNPVDPAAGSLVFALPGWDLLNRFRAAGCSDPAMSLVASATHGIASDGQPGCFVFTSTNGASARTVRPRVFAPASLPQKLCTLVALPRSGTTLLTALFQVHTRFDTVFEPWNAKLLAGSEDATLPRLLGKSGITSPAGRYLFVKETSADPAYIRNMRRLLEQSPLPVDRTLLMLCRRPAHCFLSEIERRGQWWNDPVSLDSEQFVLWCGKTRRTLAALVGLVRSADGTLICYESLVEQPESMLRRLGRLVGFDPEPAQLEYEKHLDTSKVRGDINVGTRPEPISTESVMRR
ncbi:MAG: methyltransferase domain-containing protein, partial [Moraxellaceae bacterium]|nr:methyltransferase domain-containing protein [Moraxellaceae bacterium]